MVAAAGGYGYASTDMAAIKQRVFDEKADWVIYVTDAGQADHFKLVFAAARRVGWLPDAKSEQVKAGQQWLLHSWQGIGTRLTVHGQRQRQASADARVAFSSSPSCSPGAASPESSHHPALAVDLHMPTPLGIRSLLRLQGPRVSHVGFGLVQGEDGKKFKTRSGDVVRLVELLDEAKTRCK